MLQPHGYLRTRTGGEDMPRLALAVCQTDRAREHIIRMHLDRERRAREDQLQKQGRARRLCVGALEPNLAYAAVGIVMDAPGTQVRATPGLGYEADSGLLDCHEGIRVDVRDDARWSGVPANETRSLHPPAIESAIPRSTAMMLPSLVDDPAAGEGGNQPEDDPRGQ